MPIQEGEIGLKTGRIKEIKGDVVVVNVQGTLVNIKMGLRGKRALKKNQRVSVGIFDGESRIIG